MIERAATVYQCRTYKTIREYATVLIRLIHHKDADGREIGFDYGYIHDASAAQIPDRENQWPAYRAPYANANQGTPRACARTQHQRR